MTTPLYALLRGRCGLTIREASEFHRVSLSTVNKWISGHRHVPEGALR